MRALVLSIGILLLAGCGEKKTAKPEEAPALNPQQIADAAKLEETHAQQAALLKSTPLNPEELAEREKQWARNKSLADLYKQISDTEWALKGLNSYPKLNPEQVEYKKGLEQRLPQLKAQAAKLEKGDGNEK
jgi:hypothetical protein